jgi:protein phosphatase
VSIIHVPKLSLVVLIGATGSGKSSFARKHFKPTEIVSSDFYRGLVSDDEGSLEASADAFELLYHTVHIRLRRGLLTVIDATHVREEDRAKVIAIAREHDVFAIAIVLALPEQVCADRNALRPDRQFGRHVITGHCRNVRQSIPHLERERFRFVHVLRSQEEVDAVTIERQPAWSDKTDDHGPFDIIGDVHGCYDELIELLEKLSYDTTEPSRIAGPLGRKLVFVGDLVDRGPKSAAVLTLVNTLVRQSKALCVAGNHDVKLLRALNGKNVKVAHGLGETLAQIEALGPEYKKAYREFLDARISHYQFDGGNLVVAHAGMKEQYIGRTSGRVREFALYGDTTGEVDDEGLPVRLDWAAEYRGKASIVYGHTVVDRAQWLNNTICIDTGCCFGGKLTALRWPERELVDVPAKATYVENPRKKATLAANAQQAHDRTLDLADVLGKRVIDTRLSGNVTVREENATAALEVISRFAVDPRWLIYLPPTMSPCATSERDGYLEHPDEAFRYFAESGVSSVVCEEKHMGSRAVVIVCRDAAAASERFGIEGDGAGVIITRTGRRFFDDRVTEAAMLARVREAATAADLWDELATTWLALDCELMPWSAKARDLLSNQYAAVGSAAKATLSLTADVFRAAAERLPELKATLDHTLARQRAADRYVQSYQRYCWDVVTLDDYRLAPFHLLASEGAVHADKTHAWHMSTLAKLERAPTIIATRHRFLDLSDSAARESATAWWTEHTEAGGEGMVVKPTDFTTLDAKGRLIQPAVKCRGREYLRIIYGPEYDLPANVARLRKRGLAGKRSLAAREFALGVEGLERFVRREPLRRVHECVFGVLAMESEPVDPRL